MDWCRGVSFNPATAQYGSFSSCELREKLSWVFNQAYALGNNDSMACTSVGGLIQDPAPAPLASDCQVLLRQAGTNGIGKVTSLSAPETVSINPTNTAINSSRLGIGEKVAMAVGIIVALFILFAFLVIFFRFRVRNKPPLNDDDRFEKPELPDNSNSRPEQRELHSDSLDANELDGTRRYELEARHIGELHGNEIAEMQGDDGLIELAGGRNQLTELNSSRMKIER
jgi:X8 domain